VELGIELELSVLLLIAVVGSGTFAVFEVETPAAGLAGTTFHFIWCAKNGINPITAEPRRRYYELRGWVWRE
jgi:hypothetical protein